MDEKLQENWMKTKLHPRALIDDESIDVVMVHDDAVEAQEELLFSLLASQGWASTSVAVSLAAEFLRRRQETRSLAEVEMEDQAKLGNPKSPAVMALSRRRWHSEQLEPSCHPHLMSEQAAVKGAMPESMMYKSTPRLHMSQALV